jgi:hypothetical protein
MIAFSKYRTVFLMFAVMGISVIATLSSSAALAAGDTSITKLAILPFENSTENSEAREIAMRMVHQEIWSSNIAQVSHSAIDETLRDNRIRNTGSLNRKQITEIADNTGADLILLGSIDFFEQNRTPQVGFSARLLDAKTGEIIGIESRYAGGDDYITIFGLGRIENIEKLAKREMHMIIRALDEAARQHIDTTGREEISQTNPTTVILIPFLNLTRAGTVNQAVSNIVLDALFHDGYRVIEPGMVEYQLRSRFVLPFGEIDEDDLKAVASDFNAEYCITGSITQYGVTSTQTGLTVPSVEIMTRVLDASTGKLLWAGQVQRSGDDYSTVLGLGTILSPGKLLQHAVMDLLQSIPDSLMHNSKIQTLSETK